MWKLPLIMKVVPTIEGGLRNDIKSIGQTGKKGNFGAGFGGCQLAWFIDWGTVVEKSKHTPTISHLLSSGQCACGKLLSALGRDAASRARPTFSTAGFAEKGRR